MYETKLTDKQDMTEKIYVVTKHTVTLPPDHISVVPLPPITTQEIYKPTTTDGRIPLLLN